MPEAMDVKEEDTVDKEGKASFSFVPDTSDKSPLIMEEAVVGDKCKSCFRLTTEPEGEYS